MRVFVFFLAALLACGQLQVRPAAAQAQTPAVEQDIADHAACPLCGMDRGKFAHSRMVLEYEDGTVYAPCSLHCAVLDMAAHLDQAPVKVMVADYATGKLIDADKAFWIVGGDRMGVMSSRAKWAFADKAAAEAYGKEHGGELADFDGAIKAAFEDMASDTRMIRERRKARAGHKGS